MRRKLKKRVMKMTVLDARSGMCYWKNNLEWRKHHKLSFEDWSLNKGFKITRACRNNSDGDWEKSGIGYIKINLRPILT